MTIILPRLVSAFEGSIWYSCTSKSVGFDERCRSILNEGLGLVENLGYADVSCAGEISRSISDLRWGGKQRVSSQRL